MTSQTDRDQIAGRLRQARSKVFRSASEAARSLDMNAVTVRAHENGQNGISYHDLERYARRYGVDITWLLTGEEGRLPRGLKHVEYGEAVALSGQLQDGAWLPIDPESNDYPQVVSGVTPTGTEEFAVFTDPRFPIHYVEAYRVASRRTDGEYPNNSVVFAYPAWMIGHRPGDDVIVIRVRGDFCEWTLRRVQLGKSGYLYQALTSDDAPFEYSDGRDGTTTHIVGTVVGYTVRKDVNAPTIEDLAAEQAEVRKLARMMRARRTPMGTT